MPLIETSKKSLVHEDIWQQMEGKYDLSKVIGQGSFGQVRRARCKTDGSLVAIKLIRNAFRNSYEAKKLLREVEILRNFSENKNNIYCTKLHEIVIAKQ